MGGKQLYKYHKLPTPDFESLNLNVSLSERAPLIDATLMSATKNLGLPLVIKPSREGSSVGVSICKAKQELVPAIELAAKYDNQILIEKFIKGKEITVTVFKGESLTPLEICPKVDFYNYENKYTAGNTEYFLPARLPEPVLNKCKELAKKATQISGVRTYCRVDFLVTEKNEVYILEINTLPGATATSLTPQAIKFHGVTNEEFISELLKEAQLDYANIK